MSQSAMRFIPILVLFYAVLMKAVMLNKRIFLFVNLKSIFKPEVYLFKSLVLL